MKFPCRDAEGREKLVLSAVGRPIFIVNLFVVAEPPLVVVEGGEFLN